MDGAGLDATASGRIGTHATRTDGTASEMVIVGDIVTDGSGSGIGNFGTQLFAGRLGSIAARIQHPIFHVLARY